LADISGESVLQAIARFPEKDRHCATLADGTLQEALKNYKVSQRRGPGDQGWIGHEIYWNQVIIYGT